MINFLHPGRMISASKSSYRARHPEHEVFFNANIFTRNGKIWWGDLDLTLDRVELQRYANERAEDLYVMREMDGRTVDAPIPFDRAVARIIAET